MRDTWYGDKRDLVKWGTLAFIARRESLAIIVQVPYIRFGKRPPLQTPGGPVDIDATVWQFFRNVPAVERLGAELGRRIIVIGEQFTPRDREGYRLVVEQRLVTLAESKVVLLDPDTGIAASREKGEHATAQDVRSAWNALHAGDWLVIYQHAARNGSWLQRATEAVCSTCENEKVEVFQALEIAWDVAFLAVRKNQRN